ncbi:MAG: flavodoxin family protein [Bacteroidota bacterium]
MKGFKRIFLGVFMGLLAGWGLLTFVTPWLGTATFTVMGDECAPQQALIFFQPDPYYNLDEQVCQHFAEGLAEHGFRIALYSLAEAPDPLPPADLLVFCANTYNWAPDRRLTAFIQQLELTDQPTVALTVGAGSTDRAERVLHHRLRKQGAQVIATQAFWLMRPNDESRMGESNVVVARDMARNLGKAVGERGVGLGSQVLR